MQSVVVSQPREAGVGVGAGVGIGTGTSGSGTGGGSAPIIVKRHSIGLSIATGNGLNSINMTSNGSYPLVVPSMNSANPLNSANHHHALPVARVPFDAYLQHQRQLKRQLASASLPASPRIVSFQQPNTPTAISNPLLSPFPFNLHHNFDASFLMPSAPGAPASTYLASPTVAPAQPLETTAYSNPYSSNSSASHSPAAVASRVSAPSSRVGMENAHLLDDFKFPDHDVRTKSAIPETKSDGESLANLLFELDDMSFLSPHPLLQHSFSQFPPPLSQSLPATGNSQLLHSSSNSNSQTPILSVASSSSSPEQPHLIGKHTSPFNSADSFFTAPSSSTATISGTLSPRVASSPASLMSFSQQPVRPPSLNMDLGIIHESLGFLDVATPTTAFSVLGANQGPLTHSLPNPSIQMVTIHHGPQQNKLDVDFDADEMDTADDENDGDYVDHPPLSPSPSPQSKLDSEWSPQPSVTTKPRIRKVKKSPFSVASLAVASLSDDCRPRDYRCDLCKNRFLRRQDLSRHLVTHSKAKTHICPFGCGTSFGRSDALTRHVKAKRCSGAPSLTI